MPIFDWIGKQAIVNQLVFKVGHQMLMPHLRKWAVFAKKRLPFIAPILYLLIAYELYVFVRLFINLLFYQFDGTDVTYYFAVGRSMLHGLIPYQDLFETKPPGIFLLSAFSILVSGGPTFYHSFQMVIFALIPFSTVYAIRREDNSKFQTLVACIFGLSLAIFIESRAGNMQPESFGLFFGILYFLTITKGEMTLRRTIVASLFLVGSIGMKEPFLFSIFGGILLLSNDLEYIKTRFIIPCLLAALIGIFTLLILGYFSAYIHIYLPEILSGRLAYSREFGWANMPNFFIKQPFWIRGLMFTKIWNEAPWFSFILPSLVIGTVFLRNPSRWTLASVPVIFLTLYLFIKTQVIFNLIGAMDKFNLSTSDPFFQKLILLYAALAIVCFAGFALLYRKKVLLPTLCVLVAIYCVSLAVNIGGTWFWHHFTFAVPAYFALFLLYCKNRKPFFAVLLILMAFQAPKMPIEIREAHIPDLKARNELVRVNAEKIDLIMDNCGIDRYISWATIFAPSGLTKHSPMDLPYVQYQAFEGNNLQMKERYFQKIEGGTFFESDVAFENLPQEVRSYLSMHFTSTAPMCAKPFLPLEKLIVMFRTS